MANSENTHIPSVESSNPDDRIAARRIRIQKRTDARKRALLGEDEDNIDEVTEEPRISKNQIETSRIHLTKLADDGQMLVSNVRTATDAHEQERENEEEERTRQRVERLEQDEKVGGERFNEITRRWANTLEKEIPQHLNEALNEQKLACDALIDEKNKIINDFCMELRSKDEQYVKILKKQGDDIDIMVERIAEHMLSLKKARLEQLVEIESAYEKERKELLDMHALKWKERMDYRQTKEEDYLRAREKQVEDHEHALHEQRMRDWEEFNQVKVHLEGDVQILEQQLQQMRATYQLNQEKLEYNFQVLKKRDEENTITKSLQKRKVTRLHDLLNTLRNKFVKQRKHYADDNQQLSDDYRRITEHFHELQKKSKHFVAADAKKFHAVWCLNEEQCKELVHYLVIADKIVTEQQLGLEYELPDLEFMNNVGPFLPPLEDQRSVKEVVEEVLNTPDVVNQSDTESAKKRMDIINDISVKTIKRMFDVLCNEANFLVEDKLRTLLAPLTQGEQTLMTLDSIFNALGLENEKDVRLLTQYFMNVEQYQIEKVEDTYTVEVQKSSSEGQSEKSLGQCVPLIHPNFTNKVLRDFVENTRKVFKSHKDKKGQFMMQCLGERDASNDAEYWNMYKNVITSKRQDQLNALIQAFTKYNDILSTRAKLLTDTEKMRQQNMELRMLLHQYITSKVNTELQIPPTDIMQLDMVASRNDYRNQINY